MFSPPHRRTWTSAFAIFAILRFSLGNLLVDPCLPAETGFHQIVQSFHVLEACLGLRGACGEMDVSRGKWTVLVGKSTKMKQDSSFFRQCPRLSPQRSGKKEADADRATIEVREALTSLRLSSTPASSQPSSLSSASPSLTTIRSMN